MTIVNDYGGDSTSAVGPANPANPANGIQIGGDHYKHRAIQPWDFIAANGLDYFQGNIIKYVVRFRDKCGLEDLYKALHYLDKLIEVEKLRQSGEGDRYE